jgi:hypothetical protein
MLACSMIHAGEELLGQRSGLAEYARSGATMGIPLRLEPVEPDPFIEALSRPSAAVRPARTGREERERRVELVRRVMRAKRRSRDGTRNGRSAGRTERA